MDLADLPVQQVSPVEGAIRRPETFKIEKLDMLRAVSAAIVVLYHSGFDLIPAGFGVLTFFVISGFLITFLLLRENDSSGSISLKNFYIRRSLRIFPAFYVSWLIVIVLGLLHRGGATNWPQAICSLLYVGNYYQGLHGYPSSGLSHTWSLAVEEQFYVLWPWLFWAFRARLKQLLWVLSCLIPALWFYRIFLQFHGVPEEYIYTAFETRVDAILVGCVLAMLVHRSIGRDWIHEVRQPRYLPIPLIGLAVSVHFGSLIAYRNIVGFAIDPLLVALLIGQLTQLRRFAWMDSKPISYLGRISYSTYLYQQLVHPLVSRLVPEPYADFVVLPAVWLVASISYEVVEKPFLKLKGRFKGKTGMDAVGTAVAVGGPGTGSKNSG